jgi:hypothetical protein
MSRVMVDVSRFPLVVQTMRFGYTNDELREALKVYVPLLMRGQPYVIATWNEPGAATLTAPMRAVISEFQAEHAERIRRTNLGVAIVMPTFTARAAITALNWLSAPPAPQHACASPLEAVNHCCDLLRRNGIALSAKILALQEELRRSTGYGSMITPGDGP